MSALACFFKARRRLLQLLIGINLALPFFGDLAFDLFHIFVDLIRGKILAIFARLIRALARLVQCAAELVAAAPPALPPGYFLVTFSMASFTAFLRAFSYFDLTARLRRL